MSISGSVTSREFDPSINYESAEYYSSNDAEANANVGPGYESQSGDGSGARMKSGPTGADGRPSHYVGAFVSNGIKEGSASATNLDAAGNTSEPNGTRHVSFRVDTKNTDPIISALQDQGYIPNEPVFDLGQISTAVLERAVDDGLLVWQNGELVVSPQYTPGELFDAEATNTDTEVPVNDEATASDAAETSGEDTDSSVTEDSASTPVEGEETAAVDGEVDQDAPLRFETYPIHPTNGPAGDYIFEQDAEGTITVTDPLAGKHTITEEQLEAAGLSGNSYFGDIARAIGSGRIVLGNSAEGTGAEPTASTTAEIAPDHPYYIEQNADGSGFTYKFKDGPGYLEIPDAALESVGLSSNSTAAEVAQKFAQKALVHRDGEIQSTIATSSDSYGRGFTLWDADGDNIGAGYFVEFSGEGHHAGVTQIPEEVLDAAGLTEAAYRTAENVAAKIASGEIVWNSEADNGSGGKGAWVAANPSTGSAA